MNYFSLIPLLFVLAVSATLLVFLLRAIASPLLGRFNLSLSLPDKSWGEKRAVQKKQGKYQEAKNLLEEGKEDAALKSFVESFYFKRIETSPALVEEVMAHHLSVLEKISNIARVRQVPPENLAVLEDLVVNRAQTQRSYLDAKQSTKTIRQKAKQSKGQDWAIKEIEQKVSSSKESLETNASALASELDKLCKAILSKKGSDTVTYH